MSRKNETPNEHSLRSLRPLRFHFLLDAIDLSEGATPAFAFLDANPDPATHMDAKTFADAVSYNVTIANADPHRVALVYALAHSFVFTHTHTDPDPDPDSDPERDCDTDTDFDADPEIRARRLLPPFD